MSLSVERKHAELEARGVAARAGDKAGHTLGHTSGG